MKELEELFKRVTGKTFQEAADELNAGKTVEEFARDIAAHEALGKAKPEGCYCKPGQCMAPVIMGRQMPCRDPKKAHICGQPIGSGYHCEKPKGHGGSCNIVRSYTKCDKCDNRAVLPMELCDECRGECGVKPR